MGRVALLALVVALLGAGSAQAAPFTPELEADYNAALAWWGVSSPPLCSSVTEELLLTDPMGEGGARATQPSALEPCRLMVFEDAMRPGCWEEMEIRHEVGHLLGYAHNPDPLSIMNANWDVGYWCPSEAAREARAERKRSWATWRAMRRTCREAAGPYRTRCWQELRDIAAFIRGPASPAHLQPARSG